jgi:hypothetical protein
MAWKGVKKNKYGAKRVKTKDGLTFDSKREYARWLDLVLLERAGEITMLERQVPFVFELNNVRIGKYIADFTYLENDERDYIVEDSKGFRTDMYRRNKKMVLAFYGIEIRET